MRTTITIDDDVFENACAIVGDDNASNVVRVALEKMIKAEAAMRLARLGGTAPDFMVADRKDRMAALQVAQVAKVAQVAQAAQVAEPKATYKTRKKTKAKSQGKKN